MPLEPPTEAAAAEAQTFTVQVDGRAPDVNSSHLAFFPREVSVHAGDTVAFQWVDTGEPHTVTFGQMVDDAVASMEGADPEGEPPPEWAALPVLIDEATLEVGQAAAQPCFLTEGAPGDAACTEEEQVQPPFADGFTYYNSGWPEGAATFTVDVDPATPAGRYNYLCLLHVPFMSGVIEVVDTDTEVESPEDVTARGEEELATMSAALMASVDAAEPAGPNDVLAGIMPTDPEVVASADTFMPDEVTIAAGDSVTWTILGPHNIAFNAPPEAANARFESADGTVGLNMAAMAPAGGSPGMPAPPEAAESEPAEAEPTADPEAAPPPPTVVDGGEWNGEEFYNSGIFVSFPPNQFAFALTFTEPGTYPYQCLIHPGMTGVVNVE
jgi:plastocyanin